MNLTAPMIAWISAKVFLGIESSVGRSGRACQGAVVWRARPTRWRGRSMRAEARVVNHRPRRPARREPRRRRRAMDRSFDYTQKILVAVEIAAEPRRLPDMPASYTVFQRLSLAEIARAAGEAGGASAQRADDPAFQAMVGRHMSYWEERIPAGQRCFVHYAIGGDEAITAAFQRLAAAADRWTTLGVYHVEPQSSAYPASFPTLPAPMHWSLGEERGMTKESIFWFNFFPAQSYLFEKTFCAWVMFQGVKSRAGGECNQLVVEDGKERLRARGVDAMVQVNLNRFTSLAGFFGSAHDAGEQSFTPDPDYRWYGMLLRRI